MEFNPKDLAGKWFQVAATWGEKTFGCLTYNFIIDEYKTGEVPDFTLEVNWTNFNSPWNPFERGEYGAKYNLSSESNGRLCDKDLLSLFNPTYSTINYTLVTPFYKDDSSQDCQLLYFDSVS